MPRQPAIRSSMLGVGVTALLVAGSAVGAAPAAADDVSAMVVGQDRAYSINYPDKTESSLAALFDLESDPEFRAYCVQLLVDLDDRIPLLPAPWSAFPDPAAPAAGAQAQIGRVIELGYPAVGFAELGALDLGAEWRVGVDEKLAITATQAAIWTFSDGVVPDRADPLNGQGADADHDFLLLYDYLVANARDAALATLTPASRSGVAGDLIGPFTLAADGAVTEVTADLPDGVAVTDASGVPLTVDDYASGTELYFSVPLDAPAGSASVTIETDAGVAQLWAPETQSSQHLAALAPASDAATASAEWVAAVAPQFTTTPPTGATAGEATTFAFAASGTPAPTFSATGLPASLTLDPATGVLSGTAPTDAGDYPISVTASNGVDPDATQSFIWTVAPATATTLDVTASALSVPQGGSVDLEVLALDEFGNPITDPDRVTVVSDVPTDVVEGTTVTFPTASPHELTVTVDGLTAAVTVEVIPQLTELGETGGTIATWVIVAIVVLILLGAILLLIARRRSDKS